jgi:hypothetical protein
MNSLTISLIGFVIIFGGALVGMFLRSVLPSHHLRDDSRDVVKLAIGLVGTMAALVLGLLVASAKGYFDAQNTEMIQTSADIIVLDRALDYYGPETKEAREVLHSTAVAILNQTWSKSDSRLDPSSTGGMILYGKIRALYPRDEVQRSVQSQALNLTASLGQRRWLMYEQGTTAVSKPLLAIMIFWLTVTFAIWGLLAARNITIIATMLMSALSASGAIFLILEMYDPYEGLMRVSDAPLRAAIAHLGQ